MGNPKRPRFCIFEIFIRHALPHALGPIMNAVILGTANLVVGIVIVEIVFTYPGIGQLMIDAVRLRDVPTIQVCGLVFTVTYILLTLLADMVSIIWNPRLCSALQVRGSTVAHGRTRQGAKLVKLLRDGGRHRGVQILSPARLSEAIGPSMKIGLPTGWPLPDGMTTYHMSFWQHFYRSGKGRLFQYPAMSGHGGSYVLLLPNGITGFRFADGAERNPGTYDSSGLRKVSDYIRPF